MVISWIRWKGKLMLERMVIFTILKKVIDRKASDKKIIRVNLKVMCSIRDIEARGFERRGRRRIIGCKRNGR